MTKNELKLEIRDLSKQVDELKRYKEHCDRVNDEIKERINILVLRIEREYLKNELKKPNLNFNKIVKDCLKNNG